MFARLAQVVGRHWLAVIAVWAVVVAATVLLTPRWDDVTYDGDLAYMPASMTSVQAERLLEQAFPRRRSKSEMVVLASRDRGPLTNDDLRLIDRVAARLHNLLGVSLFHEAEVLWYQAAEQRRQGNATAADQLFQQADELHRKAAMAWDEALELDSHLSPALNNRAFYYTFLGQTEFAEQYRRLAQDFDPSLESAGEQLLPRQADPLPILDVWTRHTDVVGSKLRSRDRRAELVVVRLSQEFMATDNIRVLGQVEAELDAVCHGPLHPPGLQLDVTGSAAVGGDMLRSAAESIKNTELYTVILVIAILAVVYTRSAVGCRSFDHDCRLRHGGDRLGGGADATASGARVPVVELQDLYHDEDLRDCHSVRCGHGFLPFLDCSL